MVIREPLPQAVTFTTLILGGALTYGNWSSFDQDASAFVLASTAIFSAATALASFLFYSASRSDRMRSLEGETVRGMRCTLGKLPIHQPALPLAARIDSAWFTSVPELVRDGKNEGRNAVAFFNEWLDEHNQDSGYAKLAKRIILVLAADPQFPASPEPGAHGDRSLLQHSLLVGKRALDSATSYVYEHDKVNRFAARDKKFTFDDHRRSPLILLVALAHDLGKLTAFVPTDIPKTYAVVKHHDRESAVQLARFDEFWLLTTEERDIMNAVVGHYHAERGMPLARGGQAIDDLRHALVHLLIAADKRAGHEEQLFGKTQRITQASASVRSGQRELAPSGTLPVAPTAQTAKSADTEAETTTASATSTATTLVTAAFSVADRVDAALAHQALVGEALAVANTPREMKTAATRVLHADVAVATLAGSNVVIDLLFRTLLQPGRVNGTERNVNVGIRINDTHRGAKLLVLLEQPLRSAMAGQSSCPSRYFSEGGLQSHGTLSPLTSELLAGLKALGILWNPHLGSTETANAHNLYKLYGATASRIFLDRALGIRKPPFDVVRPNHDKSAAPFQPGAGYFIRVDNIPDLAAIANLPEYATYVIAGGNIFGARGTVTVKNSASKAAAELPADLFSAYDVKPLISPPMMVLVPIPIPVSESAPTEVAVAVAVALPVANLSSLTSVAPSTATLTDIFGDIFGGAIPPSEAVASTPIPVTARTPLDVIVDVKKLIDDSSSKRLLSQHEMENVLPALLFSELRALPRPLQLLDVRLADHPTSSEFIVEFSAQGAIIHA